MHICEALCGGAFKLRRIPPQTSPCKLYALLSVTVSVMDVGLPHEISNV
ncbi:MAG: hypothetical protein AAGA16_13005 [Cyanobacteria bacterium P01_E01_bin.35]